MQRGLFAGLVGLVGLVIVAGGIWYFTSRPAPTPPMPQNADLYIMELMKKGARKKQEYTPQEFEALKNYALYGDDRTSPPNSDSNRYIRQLAITALAFVRNPAQREQALQIMHSTARTESHPILVRSAIHAIGILGDASDGRKIADFLKHPDPRVRQFTIVALGRIGDASLRPLVEAAAREDPDPETRAHAQEVLQEWGQR